MDFVSPGDLLHQAYGCGDADVREDSMRVTHPEYCTSFCFFMSFPYVHYFSSFLSSFLFSFFPSLLHSSFCRPKVRQYLKMERSLGQYSGSLDSSPKFATGQVTLFLWAPVSSFVNEGSEQMSDFQMLPRGSRVGQEISETGSPPLSRQLH